MAWTKPTFYLSVLFIVITVFTTLAITGDSLVNSDRHNLNEESLDYIAQIKGSSTDSGYEGISNIESGETQKKGLLDSEDNLTVDENSDFLSTLFIKKERASAPINFFKIVYNIPTSFIITLGLPLAPFKHIINIFGYLLFIALMITLWKKII